jgi:hypothetical protein
MVRSYFPFDKLIKHRAMKTYGRVEVQLHAFLISSLNRGEWRASRPGRLTPVERASGTYLRGGRVGTRIDLDDMGRRMPSAAGNRIQISW